MKPTDPVNPEDAPFVSTVLAAYPADTVLDQQALALALGVSSRTIRRMVSRYELPPGLALGGRKVWLAQKVREYLNSRAEEVALESARLARAVAETTRSTRR